MLGVLGGMGPMATADFMAKLVRNTPARRDQDHIEVIVCSAPGIPDRSGAIMNGGPDPLPAMIAALRRLERAGAKHIAIPCNTAHHWHGALQQETALPILHIVDTLVDDLLACEDTGDSLGLLATSGTIEARVYQDRLAQRGLTCLTPDRQGQDCVSEAIGLVKAGQVEHAAHLLWPQVRALVARGADRVAMACTEIPLALALEPDAKRRLVDPTDALARACVRLSRSASPPPPGCPPAGWPR